MVPVSDSGKAQFGVPLDRVRITKKEKRTNHPPTEEIQRTESRKSGEREREREREWEILEKTERVEDSWSIVEYEREKRDRERRNGDRINGGKEEINLSSKKKSTLERTWKGRLSKRSTRRKKVKMANREERREDNAGEETERRRMSEER